MRKRRSSLFAALLLVSAAAGPLAGGVPAEAPPPPSEVCAKCHNGTDGSAIVMATSHPVSVEYAKVASADPKRYRQPENTGVRDLLINGNVECSSCHVPHEEKTDNPYRLRTRDLVKLCTSCHIVE